MNSIPNTIQSVFNNNEKYIKKYHTNSIQHVLERTPRCRADGHAEPCQNCRCEQSSLNFLIRLIKRLAKQWQCYSDNASPLRRGGLRPSLGSTAKTRATLIFAQAHRCTHPSITYIMISGWRALLPKYTRTAQPKHHTIVMVMQVNRHRCRIVMQIRDGRSDAREKPADNGMAAKPGRCCCISLSGDRAWDDCQEHVMT